MPAYQYCNVANDVNNKSAFIVAVELNKIIKSSLTITRTLNFNLTFFF